MGLDKGVANKKCAFDDLRAYDGCVTNVELLFMSHTNQELKKRA